MYLILLGAPGTGKGTQAQILAQRFNWSHISTGDMLREAVEAGTELGKTAKGYMDSGTLVPDAVVIGMLVERLRHEDDDHSVILDGFPRNLAQATALDTALEAEGKSISQALSISVPDEELVRRLSGRLLCRNCGAIYQEASNPPSAAGICDKCGSQLYQRQDDHADTVRARLVMQKPPQDLLAYYRQSGKLVDIDGLQPVEQVTEKLVDAIRTPGLV